MFRLYTKKKEILNEPNIIIPSNLYIGYSNSMIDSSINAYLINTYIKSKNNDFNLFSKKKIEELEFNIKLYKLIYLLLDIKLQSFKNFIERK